MRVIRYLKRLTLLSKRSLAHILLMSVSLTCLILSLIQLVMFLSDKREGDVISKAMLAHAVEISTAVSSAIERANDAVLADITLIYPDETCSNEVLERLRSVYYHSSYVTDLAVMASGHIICSVTGGNFDNPVDLPSPRYKNINGFYYIWDDVTDPIDPEIKYNAFGQNGIVALLTNSTFAFLDSLNDSYDAVLESKDGGFIYRQLKKANWEKTGKISPFRDITAKTCDDRRDICVSQVRQQII